MEKGRQVFVRMRLHEQREHPNKTLHIGLKKGIILEELKWDKKTEAVTIYNRFFVEKYRWKEKGDKKNRILVLTLKRDNIKKKKERKLRQISKILKDQYPMLAHSFFNSFLGSTSKKIDASLVERKCFVAAIGKAISKSAKNVKIKEREGANL